MTETGIGARVTRREDQRFITGRGRYTDDIQLARQCHAVFLRSPYAHADITRIDTSAAGEAPAIASTPEPVPRSRMRRGRLGRRASASRASRQPRVVP